MTLEQLETLSCQIATYGIPINWLTYLLMAVMALVGGAFGAYAVGFFRKTAEITAIQRKIEAVVDQNKRIADAVEKVKSSWMVQNKGWDLKHEIYWGLLKALHGFRITSSMLADRHAPDRNEDIVRQNAPIYELQKKRRLEHVTSFSDLLAIAETVLDPQAVEVMNALCKKIGQLETIAADPYAFNTEVAEEAARVYRILVTVVRKDLFEGDTK